MTISAIPAFDILGMQPLAEAVGPFPLSPFVEIVTRFTRDTVEIVGDTSSALAVTVIDGMVTAAGHPDLTDYHSPLGSSLGPVASSLADLVGDGLCLDLDSLPREAAVPLASALRAVGVETEVECHGVTAVLELPATFDEYLAHLSKKQRHEVRRKRRRYEEQLGEVSHEMEPGIGWAFAEFLRLHRLADGEKGRFMTSERELFFTELIETDGWRVDVLRIPGTDRASAALFSFADEDGLFLYNSSYDPDFSHASPGIAIVESMIAQAIREELPRFDFLKGDEAYKFRLGADRRDLYRVTAGGVRA